MELGETSLLTGFRGEVNTIFYQRTRISLWLGVVFFSLFSLLDYVCCSEFYILFLIYRLVLIIILLLMLGMLRRPFFKRCVRSIMYTAMLLGTLVISLMVVKLGGFSSSYYVGILLMIAGAFSVLPLTVVQSLFTGMSMYLVYVATNIVGIPSLGDEAVISAISNSFFFFSIIAVTTVQCFDDLQTQRKAFRAKENLQSLRHELIKYTDNLEALIKSRMEQQEETNLKFKDLYDNILDLVVLIDTNGIIHTINQHCADILECSSEEIQGKQLGALMTAECRDFLLSESVSRLHSGEGVQGIQLQMVTGSGRVIDVEMSGNPVDMQENGENYLLIIRDISKTKEMEKQVLESNQLLDTSRQAAIFGLARLAECRDDDTGAHLLRLRKYTRLLADEMANNSEYGHLITPAFLNDIDLSSVLHDIGKVGIPDSILQKPGKLTDEEFDRMKRHCEYGGATLSVAEKGSKSFSFLKMAQDISRYHHEKWDGSGYQEGLSGKDIPLSARIVALADVYDALTSKRSYKPAFNHDQALEIIVKESGRQFDPSIVEAFLKQEEEFKETRLALLLNK